MRQKRLKLMALLWLGAGLTGLQAQEVIAAMGGDASGSGGSVSYSVGQVVYTANSGTTGALLQGVQQPYEILVVTAIEEAKGGEIHRISAYPNPATELLTLEIAIDKKENWSYQLYDMHGKHLRNQKIEGNQTNINMRNLVPATYYLKVTDGKKATKTFKIIKN